MSSPNTAFSKKPDDSAPPRHPLSHVFAWVTGGLSLLNLIRDLTPLELFGRIADWVDAYSSLVRTIRRFLFDWLHWRWFSISESEGHVLVLTALFALAWVRSGNLHSRRRLGPGRSRSEELAMYFVGMLLLWVPALVVVFILPDYWGAAVTACWLLLMAKEFAWDDGRPVPEEVIPAEYVRTEVLGMLMVTVAVVLANYLFFRP